MTHEELKKSVSTRYCTEEKSVKIMLNGNSIGTMVSYGKNYNGKSPRNSLFRTTEYASRIYNFHGQSILVKGTTRRAVLNKVIKEAHDIIKKEEHLLKRKNCDVADPLQDNEVVHFDPRF